MEYPALSICHFTLRKSSQASCLGTSVDITTNHVFSFVASAKGKKCELTFLFFLFVLNFKKAPVVENHVVVAIFPMGLHYPLGAPTFPVLRPSMLAVVPLFIVSDHLTCNSFLIIFEVCISFSSHQVL